MFATKNHESSEAKTGKTSVQTGAKGETAERVPVNPLWQQLTTRDQSKITVSAPDDPYEREADRVADRVTRLATPRVTGSTLSPSLPNLKMRRKCASCEGEEERFHRKGNWGDADASPIVPPIVHEALNSPGRALDPITLSFMQDRFGQDFSQVQVHTNDHAAASAQAVNALAYTVGHDVVFGTGQYSPNTIDGRHLLAHELAHVIQQDRGPSLRSQLVIGHANDSAEHEAESAASAVASSHRPGFERPVAKGSASRPVIQRLAPGRPPTPAEAEAARQLTRKIMERAARGSVQRAGWRQFWRVVVRRFALRGAVAAGLAAIDGPLPVGDLIALGMTIWTIYEIINLWAQLWQEAEQVTAPESGPQSAPETNPAPDSQNRPRSPRDRCFEEHPTAMRCDEPPHEDETRDEIVARFLMDEGHDFEELGDCYQFGGSIPEGVIDDCNHASAVRYHCRLNGSRDEVTIFACECCDAEGNLRHQWSEAHWSINQSRRGGR